MIEALALRALVVFRRRWHFVADTREALRDRRDIELRQWLSDRRGGPINAWTGGNRSVTTKPWFAVRVGRFEPTFAAAEAEWRVLDAVLRELVDDRHAARAP